MYRNLLENINIFKKKKGVGGGNTLSISKLATNNLVEKKGQVAKNLKPGTNLDPSSSYLNVRDN